MDSLSVRAALDDVQEQECTRILGRQGSSASPEVCVLGSGFLEKDTDTHCARGLYQSSFTLFRLCKELMALTCSVWGIYSIAAHIFFTIDCHSSVLLPQTCPKLILGGLDCSGISSKAQINVWVTSAGHLVTIFQLTLSTCYCQILS